MIKFNCNLWKGDVVQVYLATYEILGILFKPVPDPLQLHRNIMLRVLNTHYSMVDAGSMFWSLLSGLHVQNQNGSCQLWSMSTLLKNLISKLSDLMNSFPMILLELAHKLLLRQGITLKRFWHQQCLISPSASLGQNLSAISLYRIPTKIKAIVNEKNLLKKGTM